MNRTLLSFGVFLGLILAFADPAHAEKKWTIQSVAITARVDSAGYMTIEENRMYRFWGKFSYAYYELPLAGLLEVDQIQLSENGEPYQLSEEKIPGTFSLKRDRKKLVIRWQFRGEYGHASGAARTFTLRYRVLGAVRVHRDVAELYYKFVGTGWDRASERVRVSVLLPPQIRREELRAWAHGPLHGDIAVESGSRLEMAVDPLPRRQFWEARAIFPATYLTAAPPILRDDRDAGPEILQQEAQWAEEANRQRAANVAKQQWQADNRAQYFSYLWILLGAGIIYSFYMYQRHGHSLRNPQKRTIAEPPIDMLPAVANYIFSSHQVTGGALLATVFDLAARNFLRFQQKMMGNDKGWLGMARDKQEITIFFEDDKLRLGATELVPYERELLNFLRTDIAPNRNQFNLDDFKKQSTKFHRFFSQWRKTVALQAGKPKLYDGASVRASVMTFMVWLMIAAACGFAVYAMGEVAMPFMIVSVCCGALGFLILRFTRETAGQLDRLHGFRDYLKKIPHNHQRYSAHWQHIDKLLVYAIALELAPKHLKPFFEAVERERGQGVFPWFVYSGGNGSTGFSSAMSAMVNAVGTSMSSASGASGGASAGGGGGAGGSGGGAG